MKTRFLVSIAADCMTIDVMRARANLGMKQTFAHWAAVLTDRLSPSLANVQTIVVQGRVSAIELPAVFQKGLDILRANPEYTFADACMDVVLGPSLSRVGCLEIQGDGSMSQDDRSAFINAWIVQNWNVKVDESVVRSLAYGERGRYLVTCIARSVIDAIAVLCNHEDLRLTSCRPALATFLADSCNGIEAQAGAGDRGVCVFLERGIGATRGNIVQFLTRDQFGPKSVERVWVPNRVDDEADQEVDRIALRIVAEQGATSPCAVTKTTWPVLPVANHH